ncbi:GNAT family N-acetyltransferase [Natrononativus amylolyticus]|uniref:GNAT family N-acetyltransferase n=1 Tax=Natrononativus amylolyticus TaxID=2963434 RepID=UPI0020CE3121|nr:GNAT family N-acetyltransferase [Natrononativus amylolyticus]
MSVHPTFSFEDDTQRAVYEYVERHGAVSTDDLSRGVRVDAGPCQSKPARSGTYTERVPLSSEELHRSVAGLKDAGYLDEVDGKLRVALSAAPTTLETDAGAVTIRPAREEDREGLVETMQAVASEGTYIVAENVVDELEREPAIVRLNEERSRVFFVAVESDDAGDDEVDRVEGETDAEGAVVGWLQVDAPELPSLRHAAELTVGVRPARRRSGIGSALLEYGLEWAAGADYRKVYQHVPGTNAEAIEFLEANDWTREGVHEGQYLIDDEYVDEVMLATWL